MNKGSHSETKRQHLLLAYVPFLIRNKSFDGSPPAEEFPHLQVSWQFATVTYRKWSLIGWQSYRLLF